MKRQEYPITVLMSVYNGKEYLSRSIESILNQTFANFEFIIIDDGSTDGSSEIIEDYTQRDERIRAIHQENMGLTKSLNKGLRLAEGIYVARQDAGDLSLPERLQRQKEFLDRHPEVVLVGSSVELIDEKDKLINTVIQPADADEVKKILKKRNCLAHGSMMYRKEEVLQPGGYREALLYAQDYDLSLRMSEKFDICNLQDVLYRYRMDGRAISVEMTIGQKLLTEYIRKLARQRQRYGRDDLDKGNLDYLHRLISKSRSRKRVSRAEYYARIAHEYSAGGRQKAALRYYLMSLKNHPLKVKNALLAARAAVRLIFKKQVFGPALIAMKEANSLPFVSVVIPTLNRHHIICSTVNQFLNQDYPAFEVIVIDQTKTAPESIKKFFKEVSLRGVRYIHLDEPGLPNARNVGVRSAQGEIIIFTDDDVEPLGKDFIRSHVRNYTDPEIVGVAGRIIDPEYKEESNPKKILKLNKVGTFYEGKNGTVRTEVDTLPGGNMSFRIEEALKAGPFDTDIIGTEQGEEVSLCFNLMKTSGKKLVFDPQAALLHHALGSGGDSTRSVPPLFKQFSRFHNWTLICLKNRDFINPWLFFAGRIGAMVRIAIQVRDLRAFYWLPKAMFYGYATYRKKINPKNMIKDVREKFGLTD